MSEILLDRANYIDNLRVLSRVGGGVDRIILVLKDNAYGHGVRLIARVSAEFGIKFACVKDEGEADEICEFFDEILILSHIPNSKENPNYIYAVNDIAQIHKFAPKTRVHLAIDTLMHRHGISLDELNEAIDLSHKKGLEICGAYTHFRSADEVGGEFFVQRERFEIAKQILTTYGSKFGKKLKFHSQNSAACERVGANLDDYIRVGMAQYGYYQLNQNPLNLKKVLSLHADRISSRVLKASQSIGYGGVFCASKDLRVATYDLGYASGLLRYDGSKKLALTNGNFMLGKMSMDSFSALDFGERICVFDDAEVFADFFKTISYEVLVKLSHKIARRWI